MEYKFFTLRFNKDEWAEFNKYYAVFCENIGMEISKHKLFKSIIGERLGQKNVV